MQRSASNKTASIRNALLAALVAAMAAGSSPGEDYIDDVEIRASFERDLATLRAAGGLPTGASLRRRLIEQDGKPLPLPMPHSPAPNLNAHEAPTAPVPSGGSEAVRQARDASLVFGHLYLCGKCDRFHANLSGAVSISPAGWILTNYHVVDQPAALVFGAMTAAGRVYAVEELLAASKRDDFALLKLAGADSLAHAKFGSPLSSGAPLFVLSHPDGHFYTLSRGHLSRKYLTPGSKAPRLQITADFARGSSGSGIFDARGELVGLATSTKSVHAVEEGDRKENLQTVIKTGIPVETILEQLHPKGPETSR